MSVLIGSAADIAGVVVDGSQEAEYVAEVLATNPICYWILGEHEGTVAICQITPNQNGTYTAVTLGNVGVGDGQVAPFFDGAASYVDVLTASLTAAFDGTEGSCMAWARVKEASVWSDGLVSRFINLEGVGQYLIFRKEAAADTLGILWNDSVGFKTQTISTSTTDWFCLMVTWSATANQTIYYFDGAQEGAIDACDGWDVPLDVRAVIGAANTIPQLVWNGYVGHVAIWDSALAPATVAALATT